MPTVTRAKWSFPWPKLKKREPIKTPVTTNVVSVFPAPQSSENGGGGGGNGGTGINQITYSSISRK